MIEILEEKYVIDDSLTLDSHEEKRLNETMLSAVAGHTNEHDHFSPLPYNPERYPFQRADCVALLGRAATLDTFQGLAPLVFPDFQKSVDRFMDTRQDLLNHAADVLQNDHDVHVVTDHRDVIGVAVGSAIVTAALYESGQIDHGDIDTQIAVSTMLKDTSILGGPAADILGSIYSVTSFVIPSSNRSNRQHIDKGYIESFNRSSRQAQHEYKQKPAVVAVAPSGTRDIRVKHRFLHPRGENGYYMGPPSDGTVEQYMTKKHLLSMGIDISKGDAGVFIGKMWLPSELQPVTKLAIMASIAEGIGKQTGIPSHYVADWEEFQALKRSARDQ